MKGRKLVLCSSLVLLAWASIPISTPRSAAADRERDKALIAKVIDDSIGWFRNKDFDLLFSINADDPQFFMYQPASTGTIRGIEEFRKYSAVWRDPAVKYARHEIRDLRINLSRSGDVAWFSAVLDDCAEREGRVGCWKDCRWTGVLEQREEKWVIVQMHFSFAADKILEQARTPE